MARRKPKPRSSPSHSPSASRSHSPSASVSHSQSFSPSASPSASPSEEDVGVLIGGTITLTAIQENGAASSHIDLIFIPSGFTQSELTTYQTYVTGNVNKLLAVNWFTTNTSMLNIYRIDWASPVSGTDLSDADILTLASKVDYDFIIVIHNTAVGQESSSGNRVELLNTSHDYYVLAHELGHSIGELGDEYVDAGQCTATTHCKELPNVHDKNTNDKWSDVAGAPASPTAGARYCTGVFWRPSAVSIMNDSAATATFDEVGLQAMDYGAGKIIGTISNTIPTFTSTNITGITAGGTAAGTINVTASPSSVNGIRQVEFYWAKAGDRSTSFSIQRSAPYTVEIDTTTYDDGSYYLDIVVLDTYWNHKKVSTNFTISNAMNIPLRLMEIAGVARTNDVVSTGIPLSMGLISVTTGIAVYNSESVAVPAQFKILEKWNGYGEDDSIKWLLVTFLATASASATTTYYLRLGTNPAPDVPVTIVDNTTYFTMAGQNFYKDFSAPFPLALKATNDTVYGADDLAEVIWTTVESGPVRACLKAESGDGAGNPYTDSSKFGFIAWIYGYAGLDRWDVKVVLKNTKRTANHDTSGQPFYFKDFAISWPRTGTAYTVGGTNPTVYSGNLGVGDKIEIYQDSSGTDRWDKLGEAVDGYAAYSSLVVWTLGIPAFRGFKVYLNGAQTQTGNFASGFASLGGDYVLVRDFWQQHPNALEITETAVTAHLLSERWSAFDGLHWLDDMQRKAWEVSFRVDGADTDIHAFNNPLMIYCGQAWCKSTNAVGYISTRYTETVNPNSTLNGATNGGSWEYNWVCYGGLTNRSKSHNTYFVNLHRFAATGDPYYAKELMIAMRHSSANTPFWMDTYSYPDDDNLLEWVTYQSYLRPVGTYTGDSAHHGYLAWHAQHGIIHELMDGYRLTGDPLVYKALEDIGTYWRYTVLHRATSTPAESRFDSWPLYNLADIYRLTESAGLLTDIGTYADIIWAQVDKTNGYYIPAVNTLEPVVTYVLEGDHWTNLPEEQWHYATVEKGFQLSWLAKGLVNAYELTGNVHFYDTLLLNMDFVTAKEITNNTSLYMVPVTSTEYDIVHTYADAQTPGNANNEYGAHPAGGVLWPLAWAYYKSSLAKYKTGWDAVQSGASTTNWWDDIYGGYLWGEDGGTWVDYMWEVIEEN